MAQNLSFMNYHTHDYVIASSMDFEQIQDKLLDAGLIDQEETSRVLNTSKQKIQQNIRLLKILFEGKRDFNPFIEILRSDNNVKKHRKLAKQISEPVMSTMEEKQKFSITGQKTFDELSLYEKKITSPCNESSEFITELFREISFIPKCYESSENKCDTESGIYSEGDLSRDSESISEEDNNIISDPEYCESEDGKAVPTDNEEIRDLDATLPENSNAKAIVCASSWKVSIRMKKFGLKMLFPSLALIGFILTHALIQQPTLWLRSLYRIVI